MNILLQFGLNVLAGIIACYIYDIIIREKR